MPDSHPRDPVDAEQFDCLGHRRVDAGIHRVVSAQHGHHRVSVLCHPAVAPPALHRAVFMVLSSAGRSLRGQALAAVVFWT